MSLSLLKLDVQISRIQLLSLVLIIKFLRAVPVRVSEDAPTVCFLRGFARVAGFAPQVLSQPVLHLPVDPLHGHSTMPLAVIVLPSRQVQVEPSY